MGRQLWPKCSKSRIANFRKILVSVKYLSAILGPEIAAPILWTPGKHASVLQGKPMSIKFLVLGGGFWGFLGGGSADFIFMGARIFQEKASAEIRGNFSEKKSWVNFAVDFWVDFSGLLPWEKQEEKIHPKIHGKMQIRIWEFRGQNPHCKDPALRIFLKIGSDSKSRSQITEISPKSLSLRKLEKAVAVRNSLLERLSGKLLDAAGKFFPDFPAARNAIPAKVWAICGNENGC